jgi:hypothetical protein
MALAPDERLAEATLRTLDGMRLNSRSLGKFGLSPAEQLSRRPDLSAGGHTFTRPCRRSAARALFRLVSSDSA